ncbi:MAG: hypothetical protein IT245_00615 [Bacteroidia bacterium]|nr:hypothetical protein [Bacteroidia bacterium]
MIKWLKSILPFKIKHFLWFVFKAPQRRWHELGYKTLWTDFIARMISRHTPKNLQPISICIGIKNRSVNLIDFVLNSLEHCEHKHLITLSIFDAGSTDLLNLKQSIELNWKGPLIYTKEEIQFTRSITFNKAVKQAKDNLILICDADMSLPYDIVKKVNQYATQKSAWFPHVWFQNEDGTGRYYTESTGMLACYKSIYLEIGGMDETIKEWGKEDWLLFFEFYKHKIGCIRTNEPHFVHHFHESLKPKDFKPLF